MQTAQLENRLSGLSSELLEHWGLVFRQIGEEVKLSQRSPTLMEVFGVENLELAHSDFLGWLLDPVASHGLGEVFLKNFLETVAKKKNIQLDGVHFEDLNVEREKRGDEGIPDIVLHNDSFFCLIENKIRSEEGDSQTERYYREFNGKYKTNKIFFVFLTREGDEAECNKFVSLSYYDVKDILLPLQKKATKPYDFVIKDYIQNLEVNILSEFKGFSKKSKLYYKHIRDIEHVKAEFEAEIEKMFGSIYDRFFEEYASDWHAGDLSKGYFWMAKEAWEDEEDGGIYYSVKFDPSKKDKPIVIYLGSDPTNFRNDFNKKFDALPKIKNFTDYEIEQVKKGVEDRATLFRKYIELDLEDKNFDETVFKELKNFEGKFTKLIDKTFENIKK